MGCGASSARCQALRRPFRSKKAGTQEVVIEGVKKNEVEPDKTLIGAPVADSDKLKAAIDTEEGRLLLQKNIELLKGAATGDLALVNSALSQGADINAIYDTETMGESLGKDPAIEQAQLHQCMVGDESYVFSISEWVALPLDATALILASRGGKTDVVKRLLTEPGIDCNKGTREAYNIMRNDQTAMHWACRQGNYEVMHVLLQDERVNVNATTAHGWVPFGLACQQGHLKIVKELLASPRMRMIWKPNEFFSGMYKQFGLDVDEIVKLDCVGFYVCLPASLENRQDVVAHCLKDERIQRFMFDEKIQNCYPVMFRGLRPAVYMEYSPQMLNVWIKAGMDPNIDLEEGPHHGLKLLDVAHELRMVEHMRVLLMHNAAATKITPMHRAAMQGDALTMKKLLSEPGIGDVSDILPPLHQAALKDDSEETISKVRELIQLRKPEAARNLLDEGKLPAAFYAVEAGYYGVAREIFEQAHGLPSSLVDELIQACGPLTTSKWFPVEKGERSFRVCYTLVAEGALENDSTRPGAMAFMKPWCSSLVAAQYLHNADTFAVFSKVCLDKNDGFYKKVDDSLTYSVLQKAALIGQGITALSCRQDQPGVIPRLKNYRVLAMRAGFSGDHESAAAHSYALLGEGLASIFESDVHYIFRNSPAKVVTVAPKNFQRMQNKLLNPAEHGDPSIARPRCAKNVDILRGCVIVKTVQELEEAFETLQKSVKVVRVKNTHDPSTNGFRGGYRSVLVNFVYQPGLTWSQLFGDKITFDFSDLQAFGQKRGHRLEENRTPLGDVWMDYLETQTHTVLKWIGLQGLQSVASENPDMPVRMIAELQLVLEPYFEGRAVSHMLFKIARCDTGAMEMVRDFHQEYFQERGRKNDKLLAVRQIAQGVNVTRTASAQFEQVDIGRMTSGLSVVTSG